MKDLKVLKIFKSFSNEEMKMFGKFLASPYLARGKNCTPLFKLLRKTNPGLNSDKISYEIIYKKLYPGKTFNKQVVWNLISELEKMSVKFLEQTALEKNKFVQLGMGLEEFGKRKLLNNYSQNLGKMEKLLEANSIDFDYFEKKGHLENYKQEYYHLSDKVQAMGNSKLKATEYQILLFLRMTVGGLNDMKLLTENFNYRFDINIPLEFAKNLDFEKIVPYARKNKFEYTFLIEIYYHSIMMLLEPGNTVHFERTRELYFKHFSKFTRSEKRNMMHWIVNYCLANSDIDDTRFKKMIFELNAFRLKEGLAFYPENQLPKAIYIQILNAALAVKEIEWAVKFIKNYTITLQPDIRDSMKYLAYAFLYFHTKEYSKVIKNLKKAEFTDIQDKFFERTLTARSYFELSELELLLEYIDSSQHFLKSNPSVSKMGRIYIHNFFKYLKKIVFIRENKNPEDVFVLKNEIEKTVEISNKKWLMEKLKELEQKH